LVVSIVRSQVTGKDGEVETTLFCTSKRADGFHRRNQQVQWNITVHDVTTFLRVDYLIYHSKFPNRDAGSTIWSGLAALKAFSRQHMYPVQLASEPIA
jgi:hypothetical protein